MRILPGVLVREPVVEEPEEEPDPDPDPDVDPDEDPGSPTQPNPPVGIFASFRGEQGVDNFPHDLNFPDPEPAHTRQDVTTAPFVAPGSKKSFSIEIRPGDPKARIDVQQAATNPKRRAEFSWRGGASDAPRFPGGQIGWVGMHFYAPSNPMATVNGCSVMQLHNNPDPGVTLALFFFGGRLRASIEGTGLNFDIMNLAAAPFLDRWNRLIVNFRPSTGSNGFIKLWINDTQLINHTGKNKPSGNLGPYLKNGTYFWGYENFDFVRRAKCFYDHIRLGNQTSNFNSVDPTNPFT